MLQEPTVQSLNILHPQYGYIFLTCIHSILVFIISWKLNLLWIQVSYFPHPFQCHDKHKYMLILPRGMIILGSLRRNCFPSWFLIPVHIIIYVAKALIWHTAPYAHIPLNTISEFIFPILENQCMISVLLLWVNSKK